MWLLRRGVRTPRPFADLSAHVDATPGTENGLASIAFAPDYASSARLYAFFTDAARCGAFAVCDDRIVELRRSRSDPDRVDPHTERTILTVDHLDRAGHHGGQLQFGSAGVLWAAVGDGSLLPVADDPATRRGKILRIGHPASARPRAEIWASGLRNPYRFSIDRAAGILVVGDVGRDTSEEIDVLPLTGAPPGDLGWPRCEGNLARDAPATRCPLTGRPGYVAPALAYSYPHGNGATCVSAVTGGAVSRDPRVPSLLGRYVFGDFCRGFIRTADLCAPGGGVRDSGLRVPQVTAIGPDAAGRMHLVSFGGSVWRLESAGPRGRPPSRRACDRRPPEIRSLRLVSRRPRGATATAVLGFRLSEPASVTLRVRSAGRGLVLRSVWLAGGTHLLSVPGRMGRLGRGAHRLTLQARDRAGNLSATRGVEFRVPAT